MLFYERKKRDRRSQGQAPVRATTGGCPYEQWRGSKKTPLTSALPLFMCRKYLKLHEPTFCFGCPNGEVKNEQLAMGGGWRKSHH